MPKEITDDVLYSSVRELAGLIRTRQISPVGLAEAYLDRLERLGPKLGAVVTVTREQAVKEARQAEAEIRAGGYRGPLHGIPYGAKDLLATAGIPTTWGAEPLKKQVFNYDATVVKRLRAAGAVLVAKLAMVELAGGFGYNNADASFTGPGRTPWNINYWSGGSSSGPGAATAAGLVAFAIGSETSGSIITPSAYCGLSGLRPTYGRVSRFGAMALSWTLDKLGPMCRTADDCGLVLAAIAGYDRLDPTSARRTFTYTDLAARGRGKRFRIGVIKHSTAVVQPEVKANFEASLKVLGEFCDIDEAVAFPDLPYGPVVSLIVNAEGASAFRDLISTGAATRLRAVNDRWGGYAGSMVLAVDYLNAMRVRGRVKRELDALYAKYDALVAPSRGSVAYPLGVDFDKAYPELSARPAAPSSAPPVSVPAVIPAGNIAGQPAISVPNGFGANHLPTGIQFTGRAWSEAKLLAIAYAYQQATDWHKQRPPMQA
jgi:aspartyl-tRNA(Asn)/glutamyl-tRNA(Gln) amidotransferase subunit A